MAETVEPDFAARHHWLVTAEWLQNHLSHPQVVIMDCRFALADPAAGQRAYSVDHIPGAHYLDLNRDLSGPVQRHGGRHPLPRPDVLAAKLTALGIRSATPLDQTLDDAVAPTLVVAYDDSRFAFAARLWWLLRYYGHDQVVVLDGGYGAWRSAGYPVTPVVPEVAQPGRFVPQLRPHWTVEISAIHQAISQPDLPLTLIDSREAERYRGEREPIDPIAGHIPGAVNYPWAEVTDASGFAQPLEIQQQRWSNLPDQTAPDPAALASSNTAPSDTAPSDTPPVVYCGSGVTACVNLLSLAMIGRFARLYPGSWSDWCSYLV
ncbi:MAG: sulfurtransferase [Elainella sp.]